MKRPESMLAAAVVGLFSAVGVLVTVSMTSCDSDGFGLLSGSAHRDGAATRTGGVPAGKPYERAPGEPDMRVRVLTATDSVKLGAMGGLKIARGEARGTKSEPTSQGGWNDAEREAGPLMVTLRGGTWILSPIQGAERALSTGGGEALLVAPAVAGGMLTINGVEYPGVLRLSPRSDVRDGVFDGVEFVPLEEYLCGVVAKEMLTGWPLGAYQVQAVAARTYALQERDRNLGSPGGGGGFDVESSDRDQVYAGATKNKAAIEAVRSTRGTVMMDGDKVLRAYFSSTCGGRTASARDTWPTGPGFEYNLAAPIQAHARESLCTGSPLYRWTTERPRMELVARLRTFGERNRLMVRQITDLAAIQVMTLNEDGRPSRYKIVEPGGRWFQLSAEELRLACNSSVGAGPAMPGQTQASGSASGAAIPDIDRKSRVHSSDFEVRVAGDVVSITGRGFGHGVGMCQYCARAMAERGDDLKVMLERFYPGARITRLY